MGAKFNAVISRNLNSTLPVGPGGTPYPYVNYGTASAMLLRLNSTLSTASAEGTQLPNGSGYTTGGAALAQSGSSVAGSNVGLPASTTSWTSSGAGGWTIASIDITDSTPSPTWFGPVNGQPITIADGNTFAFSGSAVSCSDS